MTKNTRLNVDIDMPSSMLIPRLWSLYVRVGVWILLGSLASRLAIVPAIGGHASGAELLLGLSVVVGITSWPGLACMAATEVQALCFAHGWSFRHAWSTAASAYLPAIPFLSAPLAALAWARPDESILLLALFFAHWTITASLGCLLARGAAPWGEARSRRLFERGGTLYAILGLAGFRFWRPEETLSGLFSPVLKLVFPAAEVTPPPVPIILDHAGLPQFGIPTLASASGLAGWAILASLVLAAAVGTIWKRPPQLDPTKTRFVAGPADPISTILQAGGAFALLVMDAWLLPPTAGRSRAWILTGNEALLILVVALALDRLRLSCHARSLHSVSMVLSGMAAATVLCQHDLWTRHWATTGVLLISIHTTAIALPPLLSILESSFEEEVAWGGRLVGIILIGSILIVTDAILWKLTLRTVRMQPDIDLVGWWITKLGMTFVIVSLAELAPDLFRVTAPSTPAPTPSPESLDGKRCS